MKFSYKSIALLGVFLSLATTSVSLNYGNQEPQPKPIAQTSAPLRLHVTVTNEKRFVTELNQNDFEVSIDKVPAKIVHFSNEDLPVSLGILFDASYSMWSRGTKASGNPSIVQQALEKIFALSNETNDYFLVGFNEKPQLLADWTSDGKVIVDKLVGVRPTGNTALYDACYLAVDKLQQGRHSKRVLLLLTDGQDNTSRYSFENLRELLRETGVLVYSINFPSGEGSGSALAAEGEAILSELTAISGGWSFTARTFRRQRDVNEIIETIAKELRKQYSIAVEPLNSPKDKKWHKIKLKVNLSADGPSELKKLSTRTRAGFYSLQN